LQLSNLLAKAVLPSD